MVHTYDYNVLVGIASTPTIEEQFANFQVVVKVVLGHFGPASASLFSQLARISQRQGFGFGCPFNIGLSHASVYAIELTNEVVGVALAPRIYERTANSTTRVVVESF